MKKNLLWLGSGLAAGALIILAVLAAAAPSIMMTESVSKYDWETTKSVFEETVKEHGWKIPVAHDLQATMKKFNKDVLEVTVYELCHPDHAYKILKEDKERLVSSMMPCRVSFYKMSDGKVYISRMNSGLVGSLFGGLVAEVMKDAAAESEELIRPLL